MRTTLNFLLLAAVSFTLSAVALASVEHIRLNQHPAQNPGGSLVVADSATTTVTISPRYTHFLEAEFQKQGVCFKIKDADGRGYTYLTTNNGTPNFSTVSCE